MKNPIQFRATLAATPGGGKALTFDDARAATRWMQAQPDGAYAVTVERWSAKRSNRQNAYYWGVIVPMLAEHCGYTHEEMHFALRWQHLAVLGSHPPTSRSTADLTDAEFADYCSRVRAWASVELGVYVPEPNERVTIGVSAR